MPLKVYLADLTHTGCGVATEAFPLNIGLLSSYARKKLGSEVEFTLFKYPQDLREAVLASKPDVLACSNYTWNSNLAYHFVSWAKSLDRSILTVFGGTNYPFKGDQQRRFLETHPNVDVHVYYEGEAAFTGLLERRLAVARNEDLLKSAIPGCQFLDKAGGGMVTGPEVPRLRDLDWIPSPYSSGLLDKFFDGKLTPLVETARGCPFSCNFCNAGDVYFNKVNLFSDAYVRDELEYVARKAVKAGVGHITFADNNFGMVPRDAKTAELIYSFKKDLGWPKTMTIWTGKNSKERVIEVTRLLADSLSISMSVQAMDPDVLKNIKRDNIKLEHYKAITQELNSQGRPQHAELIVPLPGETLEVHLRSVGQLLDTNVGSVNVHTLQLLHGTPYKDEPEFIERWGYTNPKFRIVPLDFGVYDGAPVFDTEPVAVDTKHMSFEDYVQSRKMTLLIDICYNGVVFMPLRQFLLSRGVPFSRWIQAVFARFDRLPPALQAILDSFVAETRSELWDSEEALAAHYARPENYEKLMKGDAGGNVLYRHKVMIFSRQAELWVDTVFRFTAESLESPAPEALAELDELKRYIKCLLRDSFRFEGAPPAIEESFEHDILAWLKRGDAPPLASFKFPKPVPFRFSLDRDQLDMRKDAKTRYGDSLAGMVKLVQRISGHHRLMRKASYADAGAVAAA